MGDVHELFPGVPEPAPVLRAPSQRDINDQHLDELIARFVSAPAGELAIIRMEEVSFLLTQLRMARGTLGDVERVLTELSKLVPQLHVSGVEGAFATGIDDTISAIAKALQFDETKLGVETMPPEIAEDEIDEFICPGCGHANPSKSMYIIKPEIADHPFTRSAIADCILKHDDGTKPF